MRGTGDARVVVADALLAPGLQRIVVEIERDGCDFSQIVFDDTLVLGGRRDKRSLKDRAFAIETVAVIEDAAGRLGAGVARGGTRLGRVEGPRRWLIAGDQTQRLVACVDDFDPANEDAAEG